MGRQAQSTVILLIMGTAIVFAAVIALAVSNVRNRQQAATINDPVSITVGGQPIVLRTNPALAVRIVRPEPEVIVQPVVVEEVEPASPTPPPAATNVEVVPTFTPAPTVQPTQAPAAASVEPVVLSSYIVQQGDTMYRITTQLATSIALMAEYGIAQDHLVPGETLSIPIGNPAFCPGRRPYAIGEGETIFRISQLYNTTKEELQRINNLDANYSIRAGQIICVP